MNLMNTTLVKKDSEVLSLNNYLLDQLNLCDLDAKKKLIALLLIDSINDSGYLTITCKSVAESACVVGDTTTSEVEVILKLIQNFEPCGVGARDVQECLMLQLSNMKNAKVVDDAINIIENHLLLLQKKDFSGILSVVKFSKDDLRQAINLIRSLNPRPGNVIDSSKIQYIIPDILVKKGKYGFYAQINSNNLPKLKLNRYYQALLEQNIDNSDTKYLKQNLQEANWFMKSLESRNETLLKVAEQIIDAQYDFFEFGEEKMKPMNLTQIATAIGMHESTVSRATSEKYLHTPRGIFELKYFFSSAIPSQTSDLKHSSIAIRALIKKIINSESPEKPYSDNQIVSIIKRSA